MIVKVEILNDDLQKDGSRDRDKVIMAIHEAMRRKANWQANGDGWIAIA